MLRDLFNIFAFPYRYHMAKRPLAPRKEYTDLIQKTYGFSSPKFHEMSGDDLEAAFSRSNRQTKSHAYYIYFLSALAIGSSILNPVIAPIAACAASFMIFSTARDMKDIKDQVSDEFKNWQFMQDMDKRSQEYYEQKKKKAAKTKRETTTTKKSAKASSFALCA